MRSLDPWKRQAIRAALRIHDHLGGTSRLTDTVQLPTHEWEESGKLVQRLEFTLRRGWKSASDSLLIDLERQPAALHGQHQTRATRRDCGRHPGAGRRIRRPGDQAGGESSAD
jgi:hypothetical protein